MFIKITQFIISLLAFMVFGLATFAYAQSAPQVVTEDVTNRNIYEARLQGTASFTNAIPFGQVYFEYGRNSVYSSETSKKSVTESGSFDEKITGLNEDTGYHYRAVLVASDGQVYFGEDKAFITKRVSDPIGTPGGDTGGTDTPEVSPGGPDGDPLTADHLDSDGDGVSDEEECPGVLQGATCPSPNGLPAHLDASIQMTLGDDVNNNSIPDEMECTRTDVLGPADPNLDCSQYTGEETSPNASFTGVNGGICADSEKVPAYSAADNTTTYTGPGSNNDDVEVTGVRGAFIGYRCPYPEGYFDEDDDTSGGTGVTVGEPERRTGGGSLISPSTPTTLVGGGSTFVDESPDGIVPKCGEPGEPICDFKFLIELIQNVISWIISISVIIMVAVITYAGVLYMISGGSPDKIKKAKGMFVKAGIGMFWVLAGWLVINSALNLVLSNGEDGKVKQSESLKFLDQNKNTK